MTVAQPQMCSFIDLDRGWRCVSVFHDTGPHDLVQMTDAEVQRWRIDHEPLFAQVATKAGHGMVGGTHYKKLTIDPWTVIEANGMGYFDGNALKYIMRYRHKDGLQDLKKAQHYLEKLIAMETARTSEGPEPVRPGPSTP